MLPNLYLNGVPLMLDRSISSCNDLQVDRAVDRTVRSIGRHPVGDDEPFGIEPAHLPESLLRPPEGAELASMLFRPRS